MKRTLVAVPAMAMAAVLALSACGDDTSSADAPATSTAPQTSAPTSPATTPSATQTPSESPSAEDTSSSEPSADDTASSDPTGAAGKLEKITVTSPSVTDPVLGHKVKVTGVAFGYVGEGEWVKPPLKTTTYVAIQVNAVSGDKFYNGVSCTQFRLSTPDARRPASNVTSLHKNKLTKDGLKPMVSVATGKSGEGWCLYYVENPTKENLTVHYVRSGLKDSKGKTYPEVDLKMPLKQS